LRVSNIRLHRINLNHLLYQTLYCGFVAILVIELAYMINIGVYIFVNASIEIFMLTTSGLPNLTLRTHRYGLECIRSKEFKSVECFLGVVDLVTINLTG